MKVHIVITYYAPVTRPEYLVDMTEEEWEKVHFSHSEARKDYVCKLLHKENMRLKIKKVEFHPVDE